MNSLSDVVREAKRAQLEAQRESENPTTTTTTVQQEAKEDSAATMEEQTTAKAESTTTASAPTMTQIADKPLPIVDIRNGSAPPSGDLPKPPRIPLPAHPGAMRRKGMPLPANPGSMKAKRAAQLAEGTGDASRPTTSQSNQAPSRPVPPPKEPVGAASRPGTSQSTSASVVSQPASTITPLPRAAVLARGIPIRISGENKPVQGSTKRMSFTSLASSKRPIKFGRGKHAHTELVPQPSDDPDDPLNWPLWKKDLNFGALLMTAALAGVMKTVFIAVNVPLEQSFNRSYTAIAALTGAPLLFSAVSGMLALMASRVWGKRPVYLVATALIFFASIGNAAVNDYNNCLAARIFQGLGWGVFDALVLGSIHDTYFEHERGLRIAIHQIVSVATLWGGPLLGGVASQSSLGFRTQFQILCGFQALSVLLIALATPETAFDRSFVVVNTPSTAGSQKQLPSRPRMDFDAEKARAYLQTMKPVTYPGREATSHLLLQAPRALVAPTTVMLALVSFLPFSALWAIAGSLSLLFAHLPFNLSPSAVGGLMAGPFLMGAGAVAVFSLLPWWQKRSKADARANLFAMAGGSALVFIAALTMGLYVEMAMMTPEATSSGAATTAAAAAQTSPFMVGGVGARVSFPALGFLLGMLAAGAYAVHGPRAALVRRSTQFTSSNLGVALRNTVDMEAGVGLWRTLIVGMFVIGTPNLVWSYGAMRATLVGFAVAQLFVMGAAGAVWWVYDQEILKWDGRVMKCVDRSLLKRTGSFFDLD